VADRTSLTGDATTVNGDVQIQFLGHLDQFQRLTNYHAGSRTAEVLLRERWLITILPLPALMKTRAVELLRRPVP
jgi:hypothetical protein